MAALHTSNRERQRQDRIGRMDRIGQSLRVSFGSLPQRAQDEGNGRSGRHSPRDVSPNSLGPRRHAPRRRGSDLLNPANPGNPVLLLPLNLQLRLQLQLPRPYSAWFRM
jgi:hypothetical protein